jgi:hypothetical protein
VLTVGLKSRMPDGDPVKGGALRLMCLPVVSRHWNACSVATKARLVAATRRLSKLFGDFGDVVIIVATVNLEQRIKARVSIQTRAVQ